MQENLDARWITLTFKNHQLHSKTISNICNKTIQHLWSASKIPPSWNCLKQDSSANCTKFLSKMLKQDWTQTPQGMFYKLMQKAKHNPKQVGSDSNLLLISFNYRASSLSGTNSKSSAKARLTTNTTQGFVRLRMVKMHSHWISRRRVRGSVVK